MSARPEQSGSLASGASLSHAAFSAERVDVHLLGSEGRRHVVAEASLTVRRGSFVSIVGGSGTGKTTLLRVLAGLTPYSGGEVRYDGAAVTSPPEGVVTVFQDYTHALLNWRTVARNVALGIERRLARSECEERVAAALGLVRLERFRNEYPWRLSGGMQQRVQIARALAVRPDALLMDEPFGALDALTKADLQDQLLEVQQQTGATIVFVTHDIEEAVYLSDEVLVIQGQPGRIVCNVSVPLPRPRNQLSTRASPEFLDLRRRIHEAIGH